jgi:hypothetical protein
MSFNSSCKSADSRLKRVCRVALISIALCVGMSANAATWREELPQATTVGSAEMTFFGLRIYQATLWSEQKPFRPDARFALQLTYHRSISRKQLVDTSIDEIKRISGKRSDPAMLARWQSALNAAFVDVSEGDQLIGVYEPGYGMRLYDRQKLLADIPDPQLAQAFFGIWLDERTKDSKLRKQLLGEAP